ncbi:MAG TPA: hypothetical protein VK530_01215 [Candidatus Acidoferrum sp.]|nr:hypothetical protein [Candidatus Acidoferrum sp.]
MKWLRTQLIAALTRAAYILLLLATLHASACNVPVFRYALERWPAENYEAFLFHRGVLSEADQQRVAALTNSIQRHNANLALKIVDLAESHGMDEQKLWRTQTNALLPWIVLRAPEREEKDDSLWTGSFNDSDSLTDSPARRELAERLLRGDSVVWLMIASGDPAQDEGVSVLLTNELKRLESTLKLPPPAPDDPAPRSGMPLRIAFSIQHLARNAKGEELFLRMLLHGEKVEQGKPVVVPVFGRARALTALSGFELSRNVFSQAAAFLCGACSCEVKDLNPGKDLLVAANWEAVFAGAPPAASEPAIIAGERVSIAPGNVAVAAAPTPARPVDAPNERRGLKMLASVTLAFVCIIVLILGITMLRSLRRH